MKKFKNIKNNKSVMDEILLLQFKKYLFEQGLSWNTVREYSELAKQFPDTIYPENPQLLQELNLFLALKKKVRDNNLRGHYYAARRLLISWDRYDLIHRLVNVKKSRRIRFGHYEDSLEKLEKMCSYVKKLTYRFAAFVQLYTGLRAIEVLSLQRDNITIDEEGGMLLKNVGKGNKTITAYIPAKIVKKIGLDIYIKYACRNKKYPFLTRYSELKIQHSLNLQYRYYWNAVKNAAKQCGLEKFSTHDFRRNFITRLFEKGYDFETVRQLANHTSIINTIRYRKESPIDFKKVTNEIY